MKYCKNGEVRFNLKKEKDKTKNLQIFLIFNFDGRRLRFYTGKRIDLKKWDKSKQRVISQYQESTTTNDYLSELARYVTKKYTDAKILGKNPTIEYLRDKLNTRAKNKSSSFFGFIEEYIESAKGEKTVGTIKKYNNVLNHLTSFSEKAKYTLDFESIDLKFEEKFRKYQYAKGLTNNTVSKNIKIVKFFMNMAIDKGLTNNYEFKKFKTPSSDGEIVFLSWKELMHLINLDLENEKLDKVRDMFCFGCFTGLRFSDIQNLRQDNIQDEMIEITTIKTKTKAIIPLNKYSKMIYEKYRDGNKEYLFPRISNQKMNEYLKVVGKEAEFEDKIELVHYRGSERISESFLKHELLTTHIARKTFITNALERGMRTEVLMDITTHKTHDVFKRYYKIIDEHKRKEMLNVFGE